MRNGEVADLVLLNGNIITVDERNPKVEAIAIKSGRILSLGRDLEIKGFSGPATKKFDLKGSTVLPGFIDSHTHLASMGAHLSYVDLSHARSIGEVKLRLRDKVASTPVGQWVLGYRWDESRWPEGRYIGRRDLDEVAPHHPVAITRIDGHMCSVNSRALEIIPIPKDTFGFGLDRHGEPTGILKEDAAEILWRALEPSQERIEEGLIGMARSAFSLGITSVHDIVDAKEMRAYLALKRRGKLPIRSYLMPRHFLLDHLINSGLSTGFGDEWLRLGAIKVFSDGSLGSRTAALQEDFSDEHGNRGFLVHQEESLGIIVDGAHRNDFQLAVHAIGDRAIDLVLDLFERSCSSFPKEDHRHRIEHFELADSARIAKAKDLGIVVSMQPNFIGQWGLSGGMYEGRLGLKRASSCNLFREILNAGVPLAFGSDHMPFCPLYGMHWAVNAPLKEQRITVEEAIRCYTLNGAYASFEERIKGSLEIGKFADLVVLSSDPFQHSEKILDIRVDMTMVGGEVVYMKR